VEAYFVLTVSSPNHYFKYLTNIGWSGEDASLNLDDAERFHTLSDAQIAVADLMSSDDSPYEHIEIQRVRTVVTFVEGVGR
jgi:hypothetical protein